jgi:hypothetical protein
LYYSLALLSKVICYVCIILFIYFIANPFMVRTKYYYIYYNYNHLLDVSQWLFLLLLLDSDPLSIKTLLLFSSDPCYGADHNIILFDHHTFYFVFNLQLNTFVFLYLFQRHTLRLHSIFNFRVCNLSCLLYILTIRSYIIKWETVDEFTCYGVTVRHPNFI